RDPFARPMLPGAEEARQTAGFTIGKGPQQHGVGDSEDRGAGPDTEREDRERGDRKAPVAAQRTKREAQVLHAALEPHERPRPNFGAPFPDESGVAEPAPRRGAGLLGRHSRLEVVPYLQLD